MVSQGFLANLLSLLPPYFPSLKDFYLFPSNLHYNPLNTHEVIIINFLPIPLINQFAISPNHFVMLVLNHPVPPINGLLFLA